MQLWASDSQAEIGSLRDETSIALRDLRKSSSGISERVSEVAEELGDRIGQVVIEKEVTQVLQGMVNLLVDNQSNWVEQQLQDEVQQDREGRISFEERMEVRSIALHFVSFIYMKGGMFVFVVQRSGLECVSSRDASGIGDGGNDISSGASRYARTSSTD